MITVLIDWNAEAETLRETIGSIAAKSDFLQNVHVTVLCETRQEACDALAGEKTVQDLQFVERKERPLGVILQELLPQLQTKFVTVIRSGELYGPGALSALCSYLDDVCDKTDGAVPRSLRVRGKWKEPHAVLQERSVCDLTKTEEILRTPGRLRGMVFRTEALRSEPVDYRFGSGAWDAYVIRILMRKKTLAYLNDAVFCPVADGTDRYDGFPEYGSEAWYLDMAETYFGRLAEQFRQPDGTVDAFVQAQLLFSMTAQFTKQMDSTDGALQGEALDRYLQMAGSCLREISGAFLFPHGTVHAQRRIPMAVLPAFLRLKFEPFRDSFTVHSGQICVQTGQTGSVQEFEPYVLLQLMEAENGVLRLDLAIDRFVADSALQFSVKVNQKTVPVREVRRFAHRLFFGRPLTERKTLVLELPTDRLENTNTVEFVLTDRRGQELVLPVVTGDYEAKLTRKPEYSYWCFENYMAVLRRCGEQADGILLVKAGKGKRMVRELRLLHEILTSRFGSKRMFAMRCLYWLTYPVFSRKRIWLTFDKLYKGGDCGEYFYKYMESRRKEGITPAYVIKADAPDRKRLETEGYRPLIYGTWKQRLFYLHADMVFATHSSVHGFCGFSKWEVRFVQDRLRAVNTCIQHGLSVQDLTLDSNRIVNNNKRYYCASRYEVENLSRPSYDYDPDVLRLTGIPRYDGLVNRDQRQILITPTWRSYIAMPAVMGAARPYNPDFKKTDYYKIFQALLENEKLAKTAQETGYRVIYLLHPVISSQKEDFRPSGGVELLTALDVNYEQILTQSSLMVTDYSGVQFDFAYMRKPVVYFHPPQLPPHYEEGGFCYETQGFGEICTETQQLVDTLCSYMRSGCVLKDFYRARQDDFFAFDDRENCRRIFEDALQFRKEYSRTKR